MGNMLEKTKSMKDFADHGSALFKMSIISASSRT